MVLQELERLSLLEQWLTIQIVASSECLVPNWCRNTSEKVLVLLENSSSWQELMLHPLSSWMKSILLEDHVLKAREEILKCRELCLNC
jgi:hypothetical protein